MLPYPGSSSRGTLPEIGFAEPILSGGGAMPKGFGTTLRSCLDVRTGCQRAKNGEVNGDLMHSGEKKNRSSWHCICEGHGKGPRLLRMVSFAMLEERMQIWLEVGSAITAGMSFSSLSLRHHRDPQSNLGRPLRKGSLAPRVPAPGQEVRQVLGCDGGCPCWTAGRHWPRRCRSQLSPRHCNYSTI